MVKIPHSIKEFVETQGIIVVGTIGGETISNISPRIFFVVEEDSIYWLDFFKHKSYKNMQINSWVTVSVFDKEDLNGFQFRGVVSFITDEPIRTEIKDMIIKKTLREFPSNKKVEALSRRDAQIIQFEPRVCYSLNPEEYTDMCIGSDIDSTQIFEK
ncbi:MAG: pyridoxamine 5'-phosphate oxidase family protein [Nitrosarchaeum sp.]|nr:pyridoxamine 5'-phosphate oxidase family protein [Nitrosarchaeum sp.]MCA9819814.1 pyridoxamine 5'-phosphate oxidase family protein [Nitrosarchaeum sp.]